LEGGHDDKYSKITGSHAINDSHADLHHSASHHKLLLEQKEDAEISGLEIFDQSKEIFKHLSDKHNIHTNDCSVINVIITYDAKHAVVISQNTHTK
jgi:hypothetical protein